MNQLTKARWIAAQMGANEDDVLDALYGNITRPSDFVWDVQDLSAQYDDDFRRGNERLRK